MQTVHNCRFCAVAEGKRPHGISDTPFHENEQFFAVASIGALVEGWTLIVPKKHSVSLRDTYGTPAFTDFLFQVTNRVTAKYGPTVIFEHGPSHEGSLTSCGTDHAHLHVVPLPFLLDEDIKKSEFLWKSVRTSEIAKLAQGREYLFYSPHAHEPDPTGSLHILEEPVSQYFRKLIAAKLGKLDVADYRQFLHLENAENTQLRLSSAFL